MKKIAVALVLALGVNVLACGGMTQISDADLHTVKSGVSEPSGQACLAYMDNAVVMC